MNKATKEITPVEYSTAAVKVLHLTIEPDNTCFQLHWHDRIEIIRVKKGQMLLQCQNNTLKLKEGEMTVFPPKMVHGGRADDKGVEYDVLMFDLKTFYNQTDVCKRFFSTLSDGSAKFERIISDRETVSCADQICSSADLDSLEIIALVYKLISLLFKKHICEIRPECNTKIKLVIDFIEKNYKQDINTKTISEKFGYSSEHLCRKFKEATGITPMSYLRICRLEQSLKMIKSDEYSISEVALECGFSDANYFTRCFKSRYSLSPKQYKNKA